MRPGKHNALENDELSRLQERHQRTKASMRAKVKHPFHVVKNPFNHCKVRYQGLAKNEAQSFSPFDCARGTPKHRKL